MVESVRNHPKNKQNMSFRLQKEANMNDMNFMNHENTDSFIGLWQNPN